MTNPSHSDDGASIAPTRMTERVLTIDILRGFALLGILMVNMEMFNTSVYDFLIGNYHIDSTLDQWARWFIAFFAEGKFYSIFSFLFGLGMAIFMERALAKGERFAPLWLRRMAALLVFGLLHTFFFWVGDILVLYSLLGTMIFLFFRNRKPRTLVIWSIVALAIPVLLNLALFGLLQLASMAPDGGAEVTNGMALQEQIWKAQAEINNVIYATGSFAEITAVRVQETLAMWGVIPFMGFNVLATMLLGFAAGKAKWHRNLAARVPTLRKLALWGLVIGVIGNLLYVIGMENSNRIVVTGWSLLGTTGQTIGAPALAIFYMSAIALLCQRPLWHDRLLPMASAGRMAITNYLMQSLICTLLFYGYGLGFFGIGAALGILLTVVIWLLQVAMSVWWLKRFRFGPVEWLWRVITYWSGQPIRKERSNVAEALA